MTTNSEIPMPWVVRMLQAPGSDTLYRSAIDNWGSKQVAVAIEGCNELQRSIARNYYGGRPDRTDLVEAAADYIVITGQMILYYNLPILKGGYHYAPGACSPADLGLSLGMVVGLLWGEFRKGTKVKPSYLTSAISRSMMQFDHFVSEQGLAADVEKRLLEKHESLHTLLSESSPPSK